MEVLNGRDQRVELIEELVKESKVIISLRVNYPGIQKDNEITRFIILELDKIIEHEFDVSSKYFLNQGEGYVYLYLLNTHDALTIKQATMTIENKHPLGRLVDLDVYYKGLKSISRSELNESRRRCFLCNEDAFLCIRNKTHRTEEIIQYINEVVHHYGK